MTRRLSAAVAVFAITVPFGPAGNALAGGHADRARHQDNSGHSPGSQPQHREKPEAGGRPTHPGSSGSGAEKPRRPRSKPSRPERSAAAAPKPASRGRGPSSPSTSSPARRPSGRGPSSKGDPAPQSTAGRTTICHATGSATNPYVMITVSDNALAAHRAHHGGRDIIPAPAGGCPTGSEKSGKAPGARGGASARGRTTICHATGSSTNPYVMITVSDNALAAHRAHQGGRDIIPAPAEGCPGPAEGATSAVREAGRRPPAAEGLSPGVLGDTGSLSDAPATGPGVLGAFAESAGPRSGAALGGDDRRESGADAPAASGRLPFSGLEVGLVIALGLGAMLAGLALQRSLGRHSA